MQLDPQKVEDAFQDTLSRIRQRTDAVHENPRPAFDRQLSRDVLADAVQGRRIEAYKQALERLGFVYVPPERLPLWVNGAPHTEGEWHLLRHPLGLRFAFTTSEILANFRSPEDLWVFMQQQENRTRAARAGLVVPG